MLLARTTPDFVQKLARAAIDIFALQQLFIGPDPSVLTHIAPQWVAGAIVTVLAHSVALLAALLLLLLLCHLVGQVAHALAQRLHGVGLIVESPGEIVFAQAFFGFVHRVACTSQCFAGGITFRRTCAGQTLRLPVKFLTQGALTVGQFAFHAFAARLAVLALLTTLPLALLLAVFALLTFAFLALLALLTLALAVLLAASLAAASARVLL